MSIPEHSAWRAAIVSVSCHHGNTDQIAQAMAEPLQAELLVPEDVGPETLASCQLVGFGSGVYFGRHHRRLRNLVDSLSALPPRVFLFSTAGLPFLAPLYHASLRHRISRQGCEIVGEFSCRGWDSVGPLVLFGGLNRSRPNERDRRKATDFALRLYEQETTR